MITPFQIGLQMRLVQPDVEIDFAEWSEWNDVEDLAVEHFRKDYRKSESFYRKSESFAGYLDGYIAAMHMENGW